MQMCLCYFFMFNCVYLICIFKRRLSSDVTNNQKEIPFNYGSSMFFYILWFNVLWFFFLLKSMPLFLIIEIYLYIFLNYIEYHVTVYNKIISQHKQTYKNEKVYDMKPIKWNMRVIKGRQNHDLIGLCLFVVYVVVMFYVFYF